MFRSRLHVLAGAAMALSLAGTVHAYSLMGWDWTWQGNPVQEPFAFNPAGFPGAGTDTEKLDAWEGALDAWTIQGNADFRWTSGGSTTANSRDNDGVYIGQYTNSAVPGATLAWAQTWSGGFGNILDCDIEFFAANDMGTINWSADPTGAANNEMDLELVAIHEAGHCLGLDHSNDGSAIMYYAASPGTGPASRILGQDDVDGIQAIYGPQSADMALIDEAWDDDSLGASNGDGDGLLERGETIELDVRFANLGTDPAVNVVITATDNHPSVTLTTDTVNLGTLNDGASEWASNADTPLVFTIDSACNTNFTLDINLRLEDDALDVWAATASHEVRCRFDNDNDGYDDTVDCDDNNATIHPGATEQWYDGIDQNCDGANDDDQDGDGVLGNGGPDCDDTDPAVNPGATEVCNNIDDDCDGSIDVGATDLSTWHVDADGDGYGTAATVTTCGQPSNTADNDLDCDDTDDRIYPGAPEVCDNTDQDCDGVIDDNSTDAGLWHRDWDGDGYGAPSEGIVACFPSGYVGNDLDCDDGRASAYPGAPELCNNVDDDCDNAVDEGVPQAAAWYPDADKDGWGDANAAGTVTCTAPTGYVDRTGDCNDRLATINPDADELCDLYDIDQDCDGLTDDGDPDAVGQLWWYPDVDGDGYGDPSSGGAFVCDPPQDWVRDDRDCDDSASAVNIAADEVCNGIDDDCSGAVDDDAVDAIASWSDADGDGFGDPATRLDSCSPPASSVSNGSDCNDSNAAVNPNATEVCNNLDDDCDTRIDTGAIDLGTWFIDADADGYGFSTDIVFACLAPPGYAPNQDDCDDARGWVNPGAVEVCNGYDDDCDALIDEGGISNATWYADVDNDGYGDPNNTQQSCSKPAGYTDDRSDCNDNDFSISPDADETCDGTDENCNGFTDEPNPTAPLWYRDTDGDGFGDDNDTRQQCWQPLGFVANGGDCDEADVTLNPGATEVCNDIDDDCDGTPDDGVAATPWWTDADGDGYGDPAMQTVVCQQPANAVANALDCHDGDDAVSPAATEACNGVDDDCDGTVDNNAAEAVLWYADSDGDGYGGPNNPANVVACFQPSSFHLLDNQDCNDLDGDIHPGATETCDGVDEDCDGTIDEGAGGTGTWYTDADADGWGDPASPVTACAQPSGTVTNDQDCDDSAFAVKPGATEICNNIDDNCNGVTDGDAIDRVDFWEDADSDGYGDPNSQRTRCSQPSGFVDNDWDCNDNNDRIHLDAPEVCDNADNDCDGLTDEDQDVVGAPVWYYDFDEDGYGDPTQTTESCRQPFQHVANADDCDPLDGDIYPNAPGYDADCEPLPVEEDTDTPATDDDRPKTFSDPPLCGCGYTGGVSASWLGLVVMLGLRRKRRPSPVS